MTKEEQIREILILESEQVDDRVIAGFTELGLSKVIPRLAALFPKTDKVGGVSADPDGLALLTDEDIKQTMDLVDSPTAQLRSCLEAQARKQQAADKESMKHYAMGCADAVHDEVAAAVKAERERITKILVDSGWMCPEGADCPPCKELHEALEARISEVKNV